MIIQVLPPPPEPIPLVIYIDYDFAGGIVREKDATRCAISAAGDFSGSGETQRRLEREQFQRCVIINVQD